MSKEEKKKLFKEFENDKEASFIYFKAHRIYLLCFIGVVYSIIATIFDIVKDVKYYAYLFIMKGILKKDEERKGKCNL